MALLASALSPIASGCAGTVASTDSRTVRSPDPSRIRGSYAPAGQQLTVRLDEPIDTVASDRRDRFTARLESPMMDAEGRVFAQRGARVFGTVASLGSEESPRVRLRFESVETAYGVLPIDAAVRRAEYTTYRGRPIEVTAAGTVSRATPPDRSGAGGPTAVDPGMEVRQPREVHLAAGAPIEIQLTRPILAPDTTVVAR